MRVLNLIPSFVGGGTERQLALLAPELCRLGVETHVGFIHSGANLDLLRNSPVVLHRIAYLRNHDPRILFSLLKIVRAVKPHVIQTWLTQMDVFGGVVAKLTGVPFVLSERASAMAYPGNWKNRLREFVGRFATAIVANAEGGISYWEPRARAATLQVIRNGVPLERIRAAIPADPAQVDLPVDVRLILFAGRLAAEKNIETLLDALDPVLESCPDCAALLFGDGPLRASLLARIERMQMRARVRLESFTGDLWRWMRRASVFVSVSRFEGNPNTVLEAMAIGCPLVVSDILQHREILDETSAQFCDGDSAPDVAAAIQSVLEYPSAAAVRAAAACRCAAAWSVEKAARQYIDLYETLAISNKTST